ncbi:hypothetical protein [Mariniluteicoccus flavus]
MAISDGDHILVSTFEPDLDTVERVVPVSDLRIGWWSHDSEGVDRFRGEPIVMVRACSRGGRPDLETPLLEGRSEVVTEGPLFDEVKAAVLAKYGLGAKVDSLLDRAREAFGERTPESVVLINVTA